MVNMTVTHESHRGSTPQIANRLALEDRFEVLKDIGDGSFGSVALARVRTAGASIARRGTVVRFGKWIPLVRHRLIMTLGRHQNHEEDFRVFHAVFGAPRGRFPQNITPTQPLGSRPRHLPRSFH